MKKSKKSKSTKREKIFFIITLISVIVAVGAIVHAQTGQGHPWSEITCSGCLDSSSYFDKSKIGACSNICNDDDTDGDTSSSNELQTLSSVLSKGNSAGSYSINMNNKNINNIGGIYYHDANGDGKNFYIGEDGNLGDADGKYTIYDNDWSPILTLSQSGKLKALDGFDANSKPIINMASSTFKLITTEDGNTLSDSDCGWGYVLATSVCTGDCSSDDAVVGLCVKTG